MHSKNEKREIRLETLVNCSITSIAKGFDMSRVIWDLRFEDGSDGFEKKGERLLLVCDNFHIANSGCKSGSFFDSLMF